MPMQVKVNKAKKQNMEKSSATAGRDLLNQTIETSMDVPKEGSFVQPDDGTPNHISKTRMKTVDDIGGFKVSPITQFCQKLTPLRSPARRRHKSASQQFKTTRFSRCKVN